MPNRRAEDSIPRQWLTRDEIISLFTTDLRTFVGELVREMIAHEMEPYHIENKERFSLIEQQLKINTTALAVISETNVSQNREIANIGARQAERYEQQRKEEERAAESRHQMNNTLQAIQDKMFLEATDSAKREGRKEVTDEYWSGGKKVAGSVVKAAAGAVGLGAAGKWLWEVAKRFLHHY